MDGVIGHGIDYEECFLTYQFVEDAVVELPFCRPTLP